MSTKKSIVYFEKGGKEHTDEALRIALEGAKERGIDTVLVATSTGYSGERAAEIFKGSGIKLVFVTHQTGYRGRGVQTLPLETRRRLEQAGRVVTCTDALTGGVDVGMARQVPEKTQPNESMLPFITPPFNTVIANTLRLVAHGIKVGAEIAMMAVDCDAIPPGKPVVCLGGSHEGLDSATVILPAETNRMRSLKIQEILCKPI